MDCYKNHSARIAPAPQPLPADVQQAIDAIMRGNPPLLLFTTLARDQRLFFKFFNSGLLDRGHLTSASARSSSTGSLRPAAPSTSGECT
jgi:hypothetical protein